MSCHVIELNVSTHNISTQSILGGSGKIFCSSAKILCSYDFEESSLLNLTKKNIKDVEESNQLYLK